MSTLQAIDRLYEAVISAQEKLMLIEEMTYGTDIDQSVRDHIFDIDGLLDRIHDDLDYLDGVAE